MPTGFGIIGCGMIAHFHARAIADVRGAKLAACYDVLPAAADKLAEATGCKAYHDLHAMLADPAVEVVTIGTPSGANSTRAGRGSGRETRHRRKAAGNHAPPLRPNHRSLRQGRRRSCNDLPLTVPRVEPGTEAGDRPWPLRPAYARRRHRKVASLPGLL